MHKCMESSLKSDSKAVFFQQTNLADCHKVENLTTAMATMTLHIFPTFAYHDKKQYLKRSLRDPPDMKVRAFTTSLIQLNKYLLHFLPDHDGQLVTPLSVNKINEILYHTIPNLWEKQNDRTGLLLYRWIYPIYGRVL